MKSKKYMLKQITLPQSRDRHIINPTILQYIKKQTKNDTTHWLSRIAGWVAPGAGVNVGGHAYQRWRAADASRWAF